MNIWRILRQTALGATLVAGAWLLWPARGDDATANRDAAAARAATFTLRVMPGQFYAPGIAPGGVGEVNRAFADVVAAYEQLHPEIKIVLEPSLGNLREYLVTQLSAGTAPDIVMCNVEDVWGDVHKGWYVPLDAYLEEPNPYCAAGQPGAQHWWDQFAYQAISRAKTGPDGKMYCITYDMVETAIFYNKDIFRKVGVTPPTTWDEFEALMCTLRAAGYTPLQMVSVLYCDWALDLFLDQLYAAILPGIDLLKDPVREPYLDGYLDYDEICFLFRKGYFTRRDPRFRELWRQLRRFRSFANKDIATEDILRAFIAQKAAMLWSTSMLAYQLDADPNMDFAWGVFYLPRFTTNTSRYASDVDMCVIGGSGVQYEITNSSYTDTGDPATSRRLRWVIDFLRFLTAPANYTAIVNEHPIQVPNIVGVPVLPLMQPFAEILKRRYTTTKWCYTFDLQFLDVLGRTLPLYLDDHLTLDELLDWQEKNLASACARFERRKQLDFTAMEQRWQALAPQRAPMHDLPAPEGR
ncbi:MAG: extracellular solute-binding protein [bacterium]|nr:extracellular solute-binding protein [bacterium]